MSNEVSIEAEIRRLEFDTCSAQRYAREGKIEEWVHKYLLAGRWANPGFSEGLKREKRWWNGPIEVKLTDLSPAVGIEPGMEYVVDKDRWYARTSKLAKSFSNPLSLPPLIAEYRAGELSVRDGNTRYGAMSFLGWPKSWVIIWYNSESDYHQHNEIVKETGLTKGAISTEVRTLARMGLVHRSSKLADRKDYYEAESDFYQSIRSILKERQNSEFDRSLQSVREMLEKLEAGSVSGNQTEVQFVHERLQALQDFFDAIDSLTRAVVKLEKLGLGNVKSILEVLK